MRVLQPLANMAGISKRIEVDVAERTTVEGLIERLADLYGERFKKTLYSKTGELQVIMFVDEKHGELKTELRDGATVVFMVPHAGG